MGIVEGLGREDRPRGDFSPGVGSLGQVLHVSQLVLVPGALLLDLLLLELMLLLLELMLLLLLVNLLEML